LTELLTMGGWLTEAMDYSTDPAALPVHLLSAPCCSAGAAASSQGACMVFDHNV
jgi:hypothetical protein